jgi:hypothetical protein
VARILKRSSHQFHFEAPRMATQMGSDLWWVFGNGRVHAPFTRAQITTFVQESRIVAETQIRAHTDTDWRAARDVAWLATAFLNRPAAMAAPANDRQAPSDERKPQSHLLVWAEINSAARAAFMAGVAALGERAEIAPGLWAIHSQRTAEEARQMLRPRLGVGDRLLIVDATRDRIGWVNLGPETEAKLKALWRDPGPPPPANDVGMVR